MRSSLVHTSIITLVFLGLSVSQASAASPTQPHIAWMANPSSGTFAINWDMWWGENGNSVKLEENGAVILTNTLNSVSPQAQKWSFQLSGKSPGTYEYKVLLCNADGCSTSTVKSLTVPGISPPSGWSNGSSAGNISVLPGQPHIAWMANPSSGTFAINWDMWWGENGNSVKLEENGAVILTNTLNSVSPQAQKWSFQLSGKSSGSHTYVVHLCNTTGCKKSEPKTLAIGQSSLPINLTNSGSTTASGSTTPSPPVSGSWIFQFETATLRMLQSALPLSWKPTVDIQNPSNNAPNVVRLLRIFPESKWNEYFPARKPVYTYENFVSAVAKFPWFCNDVAANAGIDLDVACRSELATLFANFAQETGWNSPLSFLPDNPGLNVPPWKQALYVTREECGINGTCIYRAYCDDPVTGNLWKCAPGANYYGRWAMQLSYNFNYGPFSQVIYGDPTILMNDPDRVARDWWLALSSAIWFHMTPQSPKPSIHDVIVGHWKPNASDIASGNQGWFWTVINILNGGVECGKGSSSLVTRNRIEHYKNFTTALGGRLGENLSCENSRLFPADGDAAKPSYWAQGWDGSKTCRLVSWNSGLSIFIPGSYQRCVELAFGVTPTVLPVLPVPGSGLPGATSGLLNQTGSLVLSPNSSPTAPLNPLPSPTVTGSTTVSTGGLDDELDILEELSLTKRREMIKNLAIGIRVMPQSFRTQRIYRTAYSYDTRPEAEKELLDQFWSIASTRYTDTPRTRVLRLISNLGFWLRDDLEAFSSRISFDAAYDYRGKSPTLQKVMDQFWTLVLP